MGAWIETVFAFGIPKSVQSRSLMGAWIETSAWEKIKTTAGSLPYGSVD